MTSFAYTSVNKVMKNDASKKQTSLLDALDRSFSLSDSPVEQTQLDTPTTPLHGQNTIDHYFEAASSSSNVKEQLRKAREIHDAEQRNAAAGGCQVLHQS
jgi:mannose/cellobiose epimerase-like protein (N-acyl-D-glucosamine 2-epimerase family)